MGLVSADASAGNRAPAIDTSASWTESEYLETEKLFTSRKFASVGATSNLDQFFPGPGIDRAIRAALTVGQPERLPGFLKARLEKHSSLAHEQINQAISNPDLDPSLKPKLASLRAWISRVK